MRSRLIALIGIVVFANAGIAGETGVTLGRHPLTIVEAVELALRQSPTVLNQVQELKRTSGLVFSAQAALLPQITASGQYQQLEPTLASSSSAGNTPFDLLLLPQGQPLIIRPNGTTNAVGVPLSSFFNTTPITNSWNMKVTVSNCSMTEGRPWRTGGRQELPKMLRITLCGIRLTSWCKTSGPSSIRSFLIVLWCRSKRNQ